MGFNIEIIQDHLRIYLQNCYSLWYLTKNVIYNNKKSKV